MQIRHLLLGAASLGLITAGAASAQPPETGIVVTHIGVAVLDVARSAQAYADLAGIAVPTIDLIDHGADVGTARTARVRLSNVAIELLQPTDSGTPLGAFLARRGQGVHHIALTMNRPGAVDLTDDLDLWLHQDGNRAAQTPAPVTEPQLAYPTCVTHVGIVVRDITRARRALTRAIGVEGTPVSGFDEARGRAEYTAFNLDNVSIELLQQSGDGTGSYADFVEAHGPRAHHLGIHLRGAHESFSMQEQVTWLEQRDGVMAVDTNGFAYIDLRPQLGLFIEALAPAANDRVYPHPHSTP